LKNETLRILLVVLLFIFSRSHIRFCCAYLPCSGQSVGNACLCTVLSALLFYCNVEGCANMMSKLARKARAAVRFQGVSRTDPMPALTAFPFVCAFAPSSTWNAAHKQHGS
jgi:hypothetical protein